MCPPSDKPPESFDEILAWLNPDRDLAAQVYLNLRRDLAKIFSWNRCIDPDGMVDQTIDRVAKRVHDLRETYEGDPKLFFYGVGNNLIKEYQRKLKSHVPIEEVDLAADPPREPEAEETAERLEECLRRCLDELGEEKRELILAYYGREKQAKIAQRNKMARDLGLSIQNLRVRMYRIRAALEQCIERCLDKPERPE